MHWSCARAAATSVIVMASITARTIRITIPSCLKVCTIAAISRYLHIIECITYIM